MDARRKVELARLATQKLWEERGKKMDYGECAQRATRF
jgi:hypothetical protein